MDSTQNDYISNDQQSKIRYRGLDILSSIEDLCKKMWQNREDFIKIRASVALHAYKQEPTYDLLKELRSFDLFTTIVWRQSASKMASDQVPIAVRTKVPKCLDFVIPVVIKRLKDLEQRVSLAEVQLAPSSEQEPHSFKKYLDFQNQLKTLLKQAKQLLKEEQNTAEDEKLRYVPLKDM